MTSTEFMIIKDQVIAAGYQKEITWAQNITPCNSLDNFLAEYIWCVIHAGMKHDIAREIESKVYEAIAAGKKISDVFKHPGKAAAIEKAVKDIDTYLREYITATDKLAYLESLPWIGPVTKYHLGKNLGLDIAKPDRHLVRIAEKDGRDCQQLCKDLARETGYRIATVDQILWRAAVLGIIKT